MECSRVEVAVDARRRPYEAVVEPPRMRRNGADAVNIDSPER